MDENVIDFLKAKCREFFSISHIDIEDIYYYLTELTPIHKEVLGTRGSYVHELLVVNIGGKLIQFSYQYPTDNYAEIEFSLDESEIWFAEPYEFSEIRYRKKK